MKCETCNCGPAEGVSVFRLNEKGVEGIWRCREHHPGPIPELVLKIAEILNPEEPRRAV